MNPRCVFLGVFVGSTASLIVVKGWLRPRVLAADSPHWLDVFVLSFPNFCEAVLGSFLVLGLLQTLNGRIERPKRLAHTYLVLLTVLVAGTYVVSQELKLHSLGGHNIYDPNDVAFSIAGLLITAVFFWRTRFELDWRAPEASPGS